MTTRALYAATLMAGILAASNVDAVALNSFDVPARGGPISRVTFHYYVPPEFSRSGPVLVLVPGMNGSGEAFLSEFWITFADRNGAVLLAPTFQTTVDEIHDGTGYYYPSRWSGEVLLSALEIVQRKASANVSRVFFYGHSAGAHFVHRFALWKPGRVAAFVAYSAAWWDPPTEAIRNVPGLIMCGESDERFSASLSFFLQSKAFEAPWVWRGFQNTGHEATGPVLRMAAAFLAHYLEAIPDNPLAGDIQTYQTTAWAERNSIPDDARVRLPSPAVAEAWMRE